MDFEYVLIAIGVILALLLLYFGFTRYIKNKNIDSKVVSTVDIEALIKALGGRENILEVKSSPSKLTAIIHNHQSLKIDEIKNLGASGIVEGKDSISMIFGKQSPLIEEDLKRFL